LRAATAVPAARRGRLSVRDSPQVRALLGDWLLRQVLPVWLDGAGLERDAARCRDLPALTPVLVDSPELLRPASIVLLETSNSSEAHLMSLLEQRPWAAGDRPWDSVVKDVLGGWVQATAWRCRSALARGTAGAHGYFALQHSVVAAEMALDASSLAVLQWTTRQRFVELTAALSALEPSATPR
jgi:hypothetical protein